MRLFDTAGIRETDNRVEREGIKRAQNMAETADLVMWIHHALKSLIVQLNIPRKTKYFRTKSEKTTHTVCEDGSLDQLLDLICERVNRTLTNREDVSLSRVRHRSALVDCLAQLLLASKGDLDEVRRCEHLRLASDTLGRITGRTDVEDLLDVIFSEF